MNPKIASSIDPTKLSNTIKGLIIGSSSLIILVASVKFNIQLSDSQVIAFADQIAQTVSAVGLAAGMIHTLYGIFVKVLHKVVPPTV
jgi:hypothetical protein